MSFKSQRIRARARFGLHSLAVGALLWPAVSFGAPDPDKIAVYVDQAKLLKIPAKAATIIIGNPLIADVTLQSGGVVVERSRRDHAACDVRKIRGDGHYARQSRTGMRISSGVMPPCAPRCSTT